jgi:tape measure domain-containing protein
MAEGVKYEDFFRDLPPVILEKLKSDLDKAEAILNKKIDTIIAGAKERIAGFKSGLDGEAVKKQAADVKWLNENTKALAEYKNTLSEVQKLQKLNAKINTSAPGSIERLNAEMNKNIAIRRRMAVTDAQSKREFDALTRKINEQDQTLKKLDAQIGRHQRNVGNYKSALGGLGASLKGIAAQYLSIYAAIRAGGEVFQTTKQLDVLRQSYKYLIRDESELTNVQGFLSDITKRYGLDIISTSHSLLKFRASIAGANFDLAESDRIFESVAKAGSVLGLNAQRMELVFLALEQMISKGSISAEELRRQLGDNLPGAMQIMARALGVSVSELMKMLKANEVLANEALPKFRKELEKTYGLESIQSIENLQTAVNSLRNEWTLFVSALQASGTFKATLDKISEYVRAWRYFFNPEEFLKTEGTAIMQERFKTITEALKGITDQEKIREEIIKQIKIAYNAQKEAAKERDKYDKKFKGPEARQGFAFWSAQYEGAKKLEEELMKLISNKDAFDAIFTPPPSEEPAQIGYLDEIDKRIKALNTLISESRDKRTIIRYQDEIDALEKVKKYYESLNFDPISIDDMQKKYEILQQAIAGAKILGWSPERIAGIEKEKAALESLASSYTFALGKFTLSDREEIKFPEMSWRKYGQDWVQSINSINENIQATQEAHDEAETEAERQRLRHRLDVLELELKRAVGKSSFLDEILIKVGVDEGDLDKTKDALSDLGNALKDLASAWADYATESARSAYNAHKDAVNELESRLDKERQLKDEQKANDYDRLVTQIGQEQKLKDEALKKYERAQKVQAAIDLAAQASQLSLAVAEIFATNAKLGPWGVITAIASTAAMIASFLSFQAKIKSIKEPGYAEGTEYVEGPGTGTSDSIKARLSKGERVVPERINRKLDGIDNERLPEIISLYKYNMLRNAGLGSVDAEILSELKRSSNINEKILNHMEGTPTVTPLGSNKVLLTWKNKTQIVSYS